MNKHNERLETACKSFEEDLVLYYYGEGSDQERARVESHLAGCLSCRRFLEDLRRLLPQMAKPKELPAAFWDHYYSEMIDKLAAQQERSSWWRSWLTSMQGWAVPAFGTAAVVLLGLGLTLGNGKWDLLNQAKQDPIPQEILIDASNLEFFKSMDLVESLRDLEALDSNSAEPKVLQDS